MFCTKVASETASSTYGRIPSKTGHQRGRAKFQRQRQTLHPQPSSLPKSSKEKPLSQSSRVNAQSPRQQGHPPNTRAGNTENNRWEGAIKVAAPGNAAGVAGIGTNIAANGSRSPNPEVFELRRSQIKSLLTNKEPVHKMHSTDRHQGPKPRTWQTVPT